MSSEYEGPRQVMLAEIELLKKKIIDSRPLPERLATCKGSRDRAVERLQQANLAVKMALDAQTLAQKEVDRLEASVKELEMQTV